MKLTDILDKIQNPATSPGELSEILLYFSAEYGKKGDEFAQVLWTKAGKWPELREKTTSDKQTDRVWDATVEGRLEIGLRQELKSLEKMMSAIRTRLRILETEARNLT